MLPYPTRTPVETAGIDAFVAECIANPKPHLAVAGGRTRMMSTEMMADWLLAHPGCTQDEIDAEFTADEIRRFFKPAKEYAIRKSGDLN